MLKKLKFIFRKPRDIQDIFNAVIDGGHYTENSSGNAWMCESLERAYKGGSIGRREYRKAKNEIFFYLGGFSGYATLEGALWFNDLGHGFEERLAIYRNWANRPLI